MTRVALLDDYQDVALQMADWQSLPTGVEVQVFRDHLSNEDALVERLKDVNIVMAMRERTPFQRSLLKRLPNLKLLITAGMRNASIDVQAAQGCGVTVCGTTGLPYPTAELTWGLILSLMRQIPREDRATRNGQWQVSMGLGLQGKTLGLMGLGRLGSQVAEVGRAFKMDLIAWSQNLTAERAAEYGATLVSKGPDGAIRHSLRAPHFERPHPQAHRPPRTGFDETHRLSGQHLPRTHRRRARLDPGSGNKRNSRSGLRCL